MFERFCLFDWLNSLSLWFWLWLAVRVAKDVIWLAVIVILVRAIVKSAKLRLRFTLT